MRPRPPTAPPAKAKTTAEMSTRVGRIKMASGTATKPTASMPMATPGGGERLPATPPAKSATPSVAAAPTAAAGERSWFRQSIVDGRRKKPEADASVRAYIGRDRMDGAVFSADESELIDAARRGDGVAFADLLGPHYGSAFKVAYGLLHDASEAEDAVQEAAFRAWRRLGNLREGASVRPWFLAIVANQCRGVRHSRWWSVAKIEDAPGAELASVDVASALDLRRALRRLSHDERLVVVLRYYLD